MAKEIHCQILAASSLLISLQENPNLFSDVSVGQSREICSVIQRVKLKLPVSAVAELSQLIRRSAFAREHKEMICGVLVAQTAKPSPSTAAGKYENYTSLSAYMTQALWELNEKGRHQAMIDHLILLGCRDPSEYSYRELAILSMVGSDGPKAACSFSEASKHSVLKLLKRLFKQSASMAPLPEDFIKHLPEHPDELQSFYPNTYALVFGVNPPIACPVDLQVLEYMRNGAFYAGREGRKSS